MRPHTSVLSCSLFLSSFLATPASAHPLSAHPLGARTGLSDCLYDLNPNFLNTGNTISTADITACTTPLVSRDLPRIDNGPPPALEDIIMKRGIQPTPLVVSGQSVAADSGPQNQSLHLRDAPPPNLGFFDQVSDGTNPILTNFLEPGNLNSWAGSICTALAAKFNPAVLGVTGVFNFNIQGTHKIASSLAHKGRFLNLFVTFTGNDPALLPRYNLTSLCVIAISQVAKSTHGLKYGAFGLKNVDAVMNIHRLQVIPTETAGQVAIQTPGPVLHKQRSSFAMPIGIFNIQIGDQADGISLFNGNGLPIL